MPGRRGPEVGRGRAAPALGVLARVAGPDGCRAGRRPPPPRPSTLAEANLAARRTDRPVRRDGQLPRHRREGCRRHRRACAVFTVVDPARMEFEAAVNETDIDAVAQGPAGECHPGRLRRADLHRHGDPGAGRSPRPPATGSVAFAVPIVVRCRGQSRLFAGMSGSADIVVRVDPGRPHRAGRVRCRSTAPGGWCSWSVPTTPSVRQQVTVGAATDSRVADPQRPVRGATGWSPRVPAGSRTVSGSDELSRR